MFLLLLQLLSYYKLSSTECLLQKALCLKSFRTLSDNSSSHPYERGITSFCSQMSQWNAVNTQLAPIQPDVMGGDWLPSGSAQLPKGRLLRAAPTSTHIHYSKS